MLSFTIPWISTESVCQGEKLYAWLFTSQGTEAQIEPLLGLELQASEANDDKQWFWHGMGCD